MEESSTVEGVGINQLNAESESPPHILNRLLLIRRIRDTVAFAD